MKSMILILSRCQGHLYGAKSKKHIFRFHFKGFYSGLKVKEINLISLKNEEIVKGNDYLLWVQLVQLKKEILEVTLLKYKKIE
jgi:hypothetical protein